MTLAIDTEILLFIPLLGLYMGADNHPTVMVETDDYSGLRQRLERRDGVTCVETRTSGRPFMIKLSDGEMIHRGTLESIDDAGLDVIGVGNSDVGGTYVHVKENRDA